MSWRKNPNISFPRIQDTHTIKICRVRTGKQSIQKIQFCLIGMLEDTIRKVLLGKMEKR